MYFEPQATVEDRRAQKKEEQSKRREKRLVEIEETKKLLDQGEFDGYGNRLIINYCPCYR